MISQALSNYAHEKHFCSLLVIYFESLAGVVAKVKLREEVVQVVVGAMLIHALHAPLEIAEKGLDSVGVYRADLFGYVLAVVVAGVSVIGEMLFQSSVVARLVGENASLVVDVFFEYRDDS